MMSPANASQTARERARAELTREITEEARRQLAAVGAGGLSLRAVARSLGMVSSALYRYYPSREDLLTALIIDAYNAIGEAAETAIANANANVNVNVGDGDGCGRARWLAACHAIRSWAVAHPHEYALIYGSPVPGYRAPQATIGPAARVPLALLGVLAGVLSGDVGDVGEPAAADRSADALTGALADQAAALSVALALALAPSAASSTSAASVPLAPVVPPDVLVPPDTLVRAVIAWTQLFGMISFELFGQFVGSFEPADALFAHAAGQFATFVGLP
jgi:AcrR family transcriptional regulator